MSEKQEDHNQVNPLNDIKEANKHDESVSFKGNNISAIQNNILDFTAYDHLSEIKEENNINDKKDSLTRSLAKFSERFQNIIIEEVEAVEVDHSKTNVDLLMLKADMSKFVEELESTQKEPVLSNENKIVVILHTEFIALNKRLAQVSESSYEKSLVTKKRLIEEEKANIMEKNKLLSTKEKWRETKISKQNVTNVNGIKSLQNDFSMFIHLTDLTNAKRDKAVKSIEDVERTIEMEKEKLEKLEELYALRTEQTVEMKKEEEKTGVKRKQMMEKKENVLKKNAVSLRKKYESEIGVLTRYTLNLEEVRNKWKSILEDRLKMVDKLKTSIESMDCQAEKTKDDSEMQITMELSVDNKENILKMMSIEEELIAEVKEVLRASKYWRNQVYKDEA